MIVKKVGLHNFKRFEDVCIDFNDITLITGANSSGKSSVLAAIAAVVQSQSNYSFPFFTDFNSDLVSAGSYRDIVSNGNTKKSVGISLDVSSDGEDLSFIGRYRFASAGGQILPSLCKISDAGGSLELEWKGQKQGYRYRSIKSEGSDDSLYSDDIQKEVIAAIASIAEKFEEESEKEERKRNFEKFFQRMESGAGDWEASKNTDARETILSLKSDPAFMRYFYKADKLKSMLKSKVAYLGPIRAYPGRVYRESVSDKTFDPTGSYAYQLVYQWKKYDKERYRGFKNALLELELADKFDAQIVQGDILEYRVKPYGHKEEVNIVDAGFGISQIAPVLVRDIGLPSNGLLMINQPEVHLHPSCQALLANYFVSRMNKRSYIVETHSEYLINRFRLLVSKGELDPERINIVFLDGKSSQQDGVHYIRINKDGSFSGAPKEFFDTYYQDSFDIAMGGFDD